MVLPIADRRQQLGVVARLLRANFNFRAVILLLSFVAIAVVVLWAQGLSLADGEYTAGTLIGSEYFPLTAAETSASTAPNESAAVATMSSIDQGTPSVSNPFRNAQVYKASQLYSLSNIGLANQDGYPAAFGDFNSDKYSDIFLIDSIQKRVVLLVWTSDFVFRSVEFVNISADESLKDCFISYAVPADFNLDGKLDLLVGFKCKAQEAARVYFGTAQVDDSAKLFSSFKEVNGSYADQPLVLDYDGNGTPDLLALDHTTGQTIVWDNSDPKGDKQEKGYFEKFQPIGNGRVFCSISAPHSNAFIDMNGDCRPDLFLTCSEEKYVFNTPRKASSWEIWTSTSKGYIFSKSGRLPSGSGQISFSDIDGNGLMDAAFPICNEDKCGIQVVYNKHSRTCEPGESALTSECFNADQLCEADPHHTFSTDNDAHAVFISFDDFLERDETIMMFSGVGNELEALSPVPIRFGDFNLDGYPDVLVSVIGNGYTRILLLANVACTSSACQAVDDLAGRTFSPQVASSAITAHGAGHSAAFFDIAEDGTLDIIATQVSGSRMNPLGVLNNYFNDAFFIKILVGNSVCPSYCAQEPKFPNPKPYGVNYAGAAARLSVTDTSGNKRWIQGAQLVQSSYGMLQTPYMFFGLGRTNNYIEDLIVATSSHWEYYSGIIPNSQLVVLPYEPSGDQSSWILEMYINPGSYALEILVSLISTLLLLGIVVLALNLMEKREDERERKKALHQINFDAL